MIELFSGMGCLVRTLPGNLFDPDGNGEPVRYLYNPDTKAAVAITGFDSDDELVAPSEVEYFERRLDVIVPKTW